MARGCGQDHSRGRLSLSRTARHPGRIRLGERLRGAAAHDRRGDPREPGRRRLQPRGERGRRPDRPQATVQPATAGGRPPPPPTPPGRLGRGRNAALTRDGAPRIGRGIGRSTDEIGAAAQRVKDASSAVAGCRIDPRIRKSSDLDVEPSCKGCARGIDATSPAELAEHPAVIEEIRRALTVANTHLSRVEQFKRFTILPAEWTPESEELTPTLKLKRRVITAKYASVVGALYADEATAHGE